MLFISCDPGSDGLSVRQLLHPPDDGGDLTAGQGVVGLIGAGAVGEVPLNDTGGIQRLHIDVIGVGKGLLAGQTGGRKLQRLGGDLRDLQTGDRPVQLGIATPVRQPWPSPDSR